MSRFPIRLAVIIGGHANGSLSNVVAPWFVARAAQRDDLSLDVIELAELDPPLARWSESGSAALAYLDRIAVADAFVIITPEYHKSPPVTLQHAIDMADVEWHRKPVAFVSYGGTSGGLHAVETLRRLLAEVETVTIRKTVSFYSAWNQFDIDGTLLEPQQAEASADLMLDDLVWWADALRNAHDAGGSGRRHADASSC